MTAIRKLSLQVRFKGNVEDVQGLLTCGLVALRNIKAEMENHERRYPPVTNGERT